MAQSNVHTLPLSKLETNNGQIAGLPKNPRQIKGEKLEKLKKNIQQYPEMLGYRGLMVMPLDNGHYVIIGGNMRFHALKDLGYKEAPCIVIPKETTAQQLKAYAILDNNNFGSWDWDMLANEWEVSELDDWGVDTSYFYSSDIDLDSILNEQKGGQNEEPQPRKIEVLCAIEDEVEDVYQALAECVDRFAGVTVRKL